MVDTGSRITVGERSHQELVLHHLHNRQEGMEMMGMGKMRVMKVTETIKDTVKLHEIRVMAEAEVIVTGDPRLPETTVEDMDNHQVEEGMVVVEVAWYS